MTFSSLRSLRAPSIKHHPRGLTVVFGSDGQVSLIGFDDGITSQARYTLPASNTGALTPGTHPLPSEPTSASPIPNLEATSTSLTGTFSSTHTSTSTPTSSATSISSSLASSSYNLSATATDTDTDLPSIPTVNYPTPDPTPVSNPRDHGVGAPFYLAIVLASISFIGCVAAFIAWWIRSRSRKRDLEFEDPWVHHNTISDTGSPFTDNSNVFEKGAQTRVERQTQPYYLPASIVRRSSSMLAVPHTIPTLADGTSQNGASRAGLDAGRYPYSHRTNDEPNPYHDVPPSQTTNLYSRPGTERLQTGLSVQESTRTLGRLRVANRVPGDVTSGDEGGMNVPRSNTGGPGALPVGENAMQNPHSDPSDRSAQEGIVPVEPPGPATSSWGRRTDTVAALRRTRRRTPETTVETSKNARYSGYLYPTLDGGSSGATWQAVTAAQEENEKVDANSSLDPLGWKSTLKSSFWQAVDAMTGNRPSDSEPVANVRSGSRFTPAPQRVASRRSPGSPIRPASSSTLPDTLVAQSQETETKYGLATSNKSVEVPHISEAILGSVGSLPPRVSHLNRDLNAHTHRRRPDTLRTDTGSVYSTDSAAARANLRKYGYGDPIPSSWSALGATRESQLDLDRMYLPLPRPIRSSSPSPLSITPSQLTLGSSLVSSSVSTRTRTHTSIHSESDLIGSDVSTLRSGGNAITASYGETTTGSMYSMSRNGTVQSGRSTISHGTSPLGPSSATSSMLSRKKGVTSRRKRPRPPPRAPSSASSVQSIESGLSIREVAVRRALLERRKKVKVAESLKGREDSLTRSRDASSLLA
ncbi:hypothetical protein OG21DRAFT_1489747 [Imleria badia]|nr:hypothetical protein OG21DRAFT_1489747 [Imleria badia]